MIVAVAVSGLAAAEPGVGAGVSGVTGVAAAVGVGCAAGVVGPDADTPVGDSAKAWPLPEEEVDVEPSGEVLVSGLALVGAPLA